MNYEDKKIKNIASMLNKSKDLIRFSMEDITAENILITISTETSYLINVVYTKIIFKNLNNNIEFKFDCPIHRGKLNTKIAYRFINELYTCFVDSFELNTSKDN